MSKRTTPAKSAAAKRTAFAGQRQQFSASRKPVPPRHNIKLQIAEASLRGTLMSLLGQWERDLMLADPRAFERSI